jgi:hypothetical protein
MLHPADESLSRDANETSRIFNIALREKSSDCLLFFLPNFAPWPVIWSRAV